MRKWYEVDFPPETAVKVLGDRDESERYESGKRDFSPCVPLPFSLTRRHRHRLTRTPPDAGCT